MEIIKKQKPNLDESIGTRFSTCLFIGANIVISLGVIIVTSGSNSDVSFHLMNNPETFFSQPHLFVYSGATLAIFGSIASFFGWRTLHNYGKDLFRFPLKVTISGIAFLAIAGPFDNWWHSNFGVDGMLSPSHLVLIGGMILCALGAMLSLSRFISKKIQNNSSVYSYLIIIAVLPVWHAGIALLFTFTLPFSKTDSFNFNPDPTFAIIFATLSLPFFTSFILVLQSKLAKNKFGIISITGVLMGTISLLANFLPIETLHYTVPFLLLSIIPFIISDLIISQYPSNKRALYAVGAILGSIFYMVYYPLQTFTYNEALYHKIIWPSIISQTYFEMLPMVYPLVVGPAIIMGILGAIYSGKIARKILKPIGSQ